MLSDEERRRALAERFTDMMGLYEVGGEERLMVRLPDGSVTTIVPVATRCTIVGPLDHMTDVHLAVPHKGTIVPIGLAWRTTSGDSFELPVNGVFDPPRASHLVTPRRPPTSRLWGLKVLTGFIAASLWLATAVIGTLVYATAQPKLFFVSAGTAVAATGATAVLAVLASRRRR